MFSAPSLSFRSFWSRRRRHAPDHQAIAFASTLVAFKSRALAGSVTALARCRQFLIHSLVLTRARFSVAWFSPWTLEDHREIRGIPSDPSEFSFAALPLFLKDRAVAQAVNLAPRHSGRFGDRFLTVPSGVLSNQSYFNEATN